MANEHFVGFQLWVGRDTLGPAKPVALGIATPSIRASYSITRKAGQGILLARRTAPAGNSTCGQLSQHRVQDTAVAVVVDFDGRIDATGGDKVHGSPVIARGGDFDGLLRLQVVI